MKPDAALSDHVLDLLRPLGGVTVKYMFGGWGFYKDTLFFALIAGGRLYFKTGPCNAQQFIDAGLDQWVYPTNKGPMKMSYHAAPEAALENPSIMLKWARLGLAAAKEAASKKRKSARTPAKKPPHKNRSEKSLADPPH